MSEWKLDVTDADIDAALEDAKNLPDRSLAVSAEYDLSLDLIIVRLDNGERLVIPRGQLQGLENASEGELADIEITAGVNLGWRQLDVDHYLPYLLEGRYASERWKRARENHVVAA